MPDFGIHHSHRLKRAENSQGSLYFLERLVLVAKNQRLQLPINFVIVDHYVTNVSEPKLRISRWQFPAKVCVFAIPLSITPCVVISTLTRRC